MIPWNGQLNSNAIYATLFNHVISQYTFPDLVAGGSPMFRPVNSSRVDGTMYGDTKTYISTNLLPVSDWIGDGEAANELAIARQKDITIQSVTLNVFKKIMITTGGPTSKQAFMDEGGFASFQSVLLSTLKDTRDVYDACTFNAYVGTHKSAKAAQNVSIDVTTAVGAATGSEKAILRVQAMIKGLMGVQTNLEYLNTDMSNQYGYERVLNYDDLVVLWNQDYLNEILSVDAVNYHQLNDGLFKHLGEYRLPAFCFGDTNAAKKTGADDGTVRAQEELSLTGTDGKTYEVRATMPVPKVCEAPAGKSYTPNAKVICKIYKKGAVPYMSGFETMTDKNFKSALCDTHRLIFGRNTLEALGESPFITVTEA